MKEKNSDRVNILGVLGFILVGCKMVDLFFQMLLEIKCTPPGSPNTCSGGLGWLGWLGWWGGVNWIDVGGVDTKGEVSGRFWEG